MTLIVYEITDISLKITPQRIFKKEMSEILFENILIKDLYELEYHTRKLLPYVYVFLFLSFSFFNLGVGWMISSVFGALAFICIFLFFIKRSKVYIPTKDQGMINLFQKQPNKKNVEEFIYNLKGRVDLALKKCPEKSNLKEFAEQYFLKDK